MNLVSPARLQTKGNGAALDALIGGLIAICLADFAVRTVTAIRLRQRNPA
jgi:hypothetical protein